MSTSKSLPDDTCLTDAAIAAGCADLGPLALRDLYREVHELAGGKEFTSAEIVAHAALPGNHRLRCAIEAACGPDCSAGKLGKLFALYANTDIAGIAITRIGEEANAILWTCQSQTQRAAAADTGNIITLPPTPGKAHAAR